MTQPTQGQAQALFQSNCALAGINLAGLDAISQIQLALATLLGPGTTTLPGNVVITGTLAVTGAETVSNNIAPAIDGVGSIGTAPKRFSVAHIATGVFDAMTLNGFGSGSGIVDTGSADSGGTGYKLLRVPN